MNAVAGSGFDRTQIGIRFESEELEVTEAATRRFAEATNDTNPDALAGRLAPPIYAVVPVLETMVAAKNAVMSGFAFHGEHDLVVHEPLRPGHVVRASAQVVGVRQRSAGVATIVHVETHSTAGELLNEQYFTSFAAGARIDAGVGIDAPGHAVAQPHGEVEELTLTVDPDQTRRYAAASGDWDPYTFDEDAARALGFPSPIVHGTCTMAFAARAIVATACDGDLRRLRRFAVRLSRPLYLVPGQIVAVRIWPAGAHDSVGHFGFEATDEKGDLVIKNGWAEVAP